MQPPVLEIDLRSPVRRVGFLLIVAAAVVLSSYRVARIAWAEEQLESYDLAKVEEAIEVDSRNPALYNRVGILLYGGAGDANQAVERLRRATQLNPHVAMYWLRLGLACFGAGDVSCANEAYERAVGAAPTNPAVLNEVGMYYLAAGESKKALQHFGQLLRLDAGHASSVFRTCVRVMEPGLVWDALLRQNPDPRLQLAFITVLKEGEQGALSQQYWAEIIANRPALVLKEVGPYLRQLEVAGDYAQVARVWRDLESNKAAGLPSRTNGELLVNGGFEQEIANVGLDWHLRSEQFAEWRVVPDGSGKVLEIDFTVPHNEEHEPIFQLVPVAPNSTYKLAARVRSTELSSDSGPRLRVLDPECPSCVNVSTDGATGTTDWHTVETSFTTPATTRFIRLSIWRPRSRSFPTEISGQFWIDEVSLRPSAVSSLN